MKDYGKDVGGGTFQLSDQWDMVRVVYTWQGVMSDGTENDTDSCQIRATVSGPQRLSTMLENDCSFQRVSTIAARAENVLDITIPGDYTINVTDQLTGATSAVTFTVI